MDLKDEFIQIIKGILNFLLWILKIETKKYIQEAFNASLSEVFITDTQDTIKQEQIQDGCIYSFKKGKI